MDKNKGKVGITGELRNAIREKTASVFKNYTEIWAKEAQIQEFRKIAAEQVKTMSSEEKAKFVPDYAYGKGYATGFEEGKLAGAREAAPNYVQYMITKVAEVLGEEAAGQLEDQMGGEEEAIMQLVEEATNDAIVEIAQDMVEREGEEVAKQKLHDPETAKQVVEIATEIGNQAVAELLAEEEVGPAEEPPAEAPMY